MSKASRKKEFTLSIKGILSEYNEIIDNKTKQILQGIITSYTSPEIHTATHPTADKVISVSFNNRGGNVDMDEKEPHSPGLNAPNIQEDELQFIIEGVISKKDHIAKYGTPDLELEKTIVNLTFQPSKVLHIEDQYDEKQSLSNLQQNSNLHFLRYFNRLYHSDGSIISPDLNTDSFEIDGYRQLTVKVLNSENNYLQALFEIENIDSDSFSEEFFNLFNKYLESVNLDTLKQVIIRANNMNSNVTTTLYSLMIKDDLVNGKYIPTQFFTNVIEYYSSNQSLIDSASYSAYSESSRELQTSDLVGTDRRYNYKLLFSNEEMLTKVGELGIISKDNQLYCTVINKADLLLIKIHENNKDLGISQKLYNKLENALQHDEQLQINLLLEEKHQLYSFASANGYYLDRSHLKRNIEHYKQLTDETFECYKNSLKQVSVRLSEDETSLEFGSSRPPVRHAGNHQMRHFSPFAFMKEVFVKKHKKVLTENTSANEENLLKLFLYEIEELINFNDIRVILKDKEEFAKLAPLKRNKSPSYKILGNKKVEKIDDKVFLIRPEWEKLVKDNPDKRDEIDLIIQAQQARRDAINSEYKQIFLDYILKTIFNTQYNQAQKFEKIPAIALVVYNTLPFVSFPTEVHTMNDEIRYYPSGVSANQSNYYIISDISKISSIKRGKIYLIANEGANITKILEAFNYYDNKLKLLVNKTLTNEIKAHFAFKIALLLWECFDFKPLEKKVLVETKSTSSNVIQIYTSLDQKNVKHYKIADGKTVREKNKNKIPKGKYTQSIIWRSEEYEEELLIVLASRHLNIVFIMNEGFNIIAEEIIATFSSIAAEAYKKSGHDANVNNIQIKLKDLLWFHLRTDEIEISSSKYSSCLSSSASQASRSTTPEHFALEMDQKHDNAPSSKCSKAILNPSLLINR